LTLRSSRGTASSGICSNGPFTSALVASDEREAIMSPSRRAAAIRSASSSNASSSSRTQTTAGRGARVDHDLDMVVATSDERLVLAYFAALEDHVERWRQVGGAWEPYAGAVPVDAMQSAALRHPNPKLRRHALGVLDHAANDASTATFRVALSDPVPAVRIVALHGLSCERCRIGDICVDDVVTDVLGVLRDDASPKVRHAAIDVLARFMSRDERIVAALRDVAADDSDQFVRLAATSAAEGERRVWSRKAVRRRHLTRSVPPVP
jgi:hypothetical protein